MNNFSFILLLNKLSIKELLYANAISALTDSNVNMDVIAPKCNRNLEVIMFTSEQRHVYSAIYNKPYYYAHCYFTGSTDGHLINALRLDQFIKQKETGEQPVLGGKLQRIVQLPYLRRFHEKDVIIIKHGNSYIQFLTKDRYFSNCYSLLSEKPSVDFNPQGITKQTVVDMIIEHDRRVRDDIVHPLTTQQIKKNQANTQKQTNVHESLNKKKQEDVNLTTTAITSTQNDD